MAARSEGINIKMLNQNKFCQAIRSYLSQSWPKNEFAVGYWMDPGERPLDRIHMMGPPDLAIPIPVPLKNMRELVIFSHRHQGEVTQIQAGYQTDDLVSLISGSRLKMDVNSIIPNLAKTSLGLLGLDGCHSSQVQATLSHLAVLMPGAQLLSKYDENVHKPGNLAKMVIQVPVEGGHEGGRLRVELRDRVRLMDLHSQSGNGPFHLSAFFDDCDHRIEEVTFGWQLVLVFDLRLTVTDPPCRIEKSQMDSLQTFLVARDVAEVLGKIQSGMLAFQLDHRYASRPLLKEDLRGSDRVLFRLLDSVESVETHLVGRMEADPQKRLNRTVVDWLGCPFPLDLPTQWMRLCNRPNRYSHEAVILVWPKRLAFRLALEHHNFPLALDQLEKEPDVARLDQLIGYCETHWERVWTSKETGGEVTCRLLELCVHLHAVQPGLTLLDLLVSLPDEGIKSEGVARALASLVSLTGWEEAEGELAKLMSCPERAMEQFGHWALLGESLKELDWMQQVAKRLGPMMYSSRLDLSGRLPAESVAAFIGLEARIVERSRTPLGLRGPLCILPGLSNRFGYLNNTLLASSPERLLEILQAVHSTQPDVVASQNFEVRSFLTSLYEGLAIAAASTPEREDTDGEEDDGVMSEEDEDEAEDERQIAIDTLVFLVEVVADRASAIVRDYVARLCQQDEEDGCRTVQKLLNSPDVWNLAGPGKSTGGCWAVKELAEFRMRQLARCQKPEFTWCQPALGLEDATPEVKEFLQSNLATKTFEGFEDQKDALDWLEENFLHMEDDSDDDEGPEEDEDEDGHEDKPFIYCRRQRRLDEVRRYILAKGFSARAVIRRREHDGEFVCVVTKTRKLYAAQLDIYFANRKELTCLRERFNRRISESALQDTPWVAQQQSQPRKRKCVIQRQPSSSLAVAGSSSSSSFVGWDGSVGRGISPLLKKPRYNQKSITISD